jgi:hypothetical protein
MRAWSAALAGVTGKTERMLLALEIGSLLAFRLMGVFGGCRV